MTGGCRTWKGKKKKKRRERQEDKTNEEALVRFNETGEDREGMCVFTCV